jgi:tetratricopeptide (TPR) repeat protein
MTIRVRRYFPALLAASLVALTIHTAWADEEKELTPNAHYMSAKLYLSQKVFDKAEAEGRAAVKGDSTKADYHAVWAQALSELARLRLDETVNAPDKPARLQSIREIAPLYATARDEFEKAMGLDPKQADENSDNRLHYWVELYRQATARFEQEDYEEAIELFKLTTVLDPQEPAGVFWVGFTMDRLGQTLDGVKMAATARAMADVRIAELGDCSQFKSKAKQRACTKKIETMQTIRTNVDNFTKSKNVAIGRASLDAATAEQDATKKRELLTSALNYLKLAREQDPSLVSVLFDEGDAYFKLAQTYEDTASANPRYRQASAMFLTLAANDSSDADSRKDALYNAIMALYASSDWPLVLPHLRKYIDMDPHDSDIWKRIAVAQSELKNTPEAVSSVIMSNALGSTGEDVKVEESVNTARNLYSGTGMGQVLSELGPPEQVRSYQDPTDPNRILFTWIWWKKGQARHFENGQLVGSVSFAPENENHSSN